MLRETLRTTLAWAIEQVTENSCSYDHVVTRLRINLSLQNFSYNLKPFI